MKKVARIVLIFLGVILFLVGGIVVYRKLQPAAFINQSIRFQNKLNIPSILMPRIVNGEKVFDLSVNEKETEIIPGTTTRTLGYNGSILGPTLRINNGDNVRIRVTNNLHEDTTVHWHGMLLPAKMDGGPHQTITTGSTWESYWTVKNEAGTLWYHPHTLEKTGEQVYQGLAGLILIDDKNSESLSLPKKYGEDDIPLIVQDKKFDAHAQFIYDHSHMIPVTTGFLGDTILVNGTYAPYVQVPAKLVRFRILNGSNARRYNFGFSDSRTFTQIASDGGFLQTGVERTRLQLSPGERAEIIVDLSGQTETLTLLSYPVIGDTNIVRSFALSALAGGSDEYQEFKILELRPQSGNFAKSEIPHVLNTILYLQERDAVKTREFDLDSASINKKKMDSSRADEIVRKGDIEIWHVSNDSPMYHPFHIHGIQFQVLSRNDQKPALYEQGWKDTITVNPGDSVKLIMQFMEDSDPTNPFMYHCHILEHEDMGMMGQFVVVDKDVREEDIKINSSNMGQGMMH